MKRFLFSLLETILPLMMGFLLVGLPEVGLGQSADEAPESLLQQWREAAQAHRLNGDWKAAISLLNRVVKQQPDDLDSTFWLATLHRWRGEIQEAQGAYRAILHRDPTHTEALVGLGQLHLASEEWDRAEALFQNALRLRPEDALVHYLYGLSLERRGLASEAAQEFKSVLQFDQTHLDARTHLFHMHTQISPSIAGQSSWATDRVLEGRGDRELGIQLARVIYSARRLSLSAHQPLSDRVALSVRIEQSGEKVESATFNRVIYDYQITTPVAALDLGLGGGLKLKADFGFTDYQSNLSGSVPESQLVRYQVWLGSLSPNPSVEVRIQQTPFLARSTSGDLRFGIFREREVMAQYSRPFTSQMKGAARYGLSSFSDGNTNHWVQTDVHWIRGRQEATWSYHRAFLLGRFLTPEQHLNFIGSHRTALDYRRAIPPHWDLAGGVSYTLYEGENHEGLAHVTFSYRPKVEGPLSIGVLGQVDRFAKDARDYTTLNLWKVAPFIKLSGVLAKRVSYQLHYAHGFLGDEESQRYDSNELSGRVRYLFDTRIRLELEAAYEGDTLHQSHQDYRGWFTLLF